MGLVAITGQDQWPVRVAMACVIVRDAQLQYAAPRGSEAAVAYADVHVIEPHRCRRPHGVRARCSRIATAGRVLPSRNSRKAPPAVEM